MAPARCSHSRVAPAPPAAAADCFCWCCFEADCLLVPPPPQQDAHCCLFFHGWQQLLIAAAAPLQTASLLLLGLGVADADAAPQQVGAIKRHCLVQTRLLPAADSAGRRVRRRVGG
jgi:hypothetical protein